MPIISEEWMDSWGGWRNINAVWFAPPLSHGDDRLVRAAQAVERVWPWVELRYRWPDGPDFGMSREEYTRLFFGGGPPPKGFDVPILLTDRDRWLIEAPSRGELPLITNNDDKRHVSLQQPLEVVPREHARPVLKVEVRFPPEPDIWRHAADLMAEVGIALQAHWGTVDTKLTASALSRQVVGDEPHPNCPPPGLPALVDDDEHRSVPYILGWVSYWSEKAAARIGFPDRARHAELLERARRVKGGGWVLQLTDEPLDIYFRTHHLKLDGTYEAPEEPRDLSNPAHLRALQRAYELLPAIGGRDKLAQR